MRLIRSLLGAAGVALFGRRGEQRLVGGVLGLEDRRVGVGLDGGADRGQRGGAGLGAELRRYGI